MTTIDAKTVARVYPFQLDRFQVEAIAAIDDASSVIVAAPTGAGKTVVATHAVRVALAEGKRVFYTAPIKALSNQKYSDLVAEHGPEAVGLLTGDNAINPAAPVVVMTTEVLRNMIYADSPDLRELGWVILDEVHYLQDPYRGPVWEEIIIHAPQAVRFVCLSATACCASGRTSGRTCDSCRCSWVTARTPKGSASIATVRRVAEHEAPEGAAGAPRTGRRSSRHCRVAGCCPPSISSSAGRPATTPPV